MAIVKYDGARYRGRCIRMDFVQKRPHEKEYGGPRSRGYRNHPSGVRRNPNSSYASAYRNPNYASAPPRSPVNNQASSANSDGGYNPILIGCTKVNENGGQVGTHI
ncbi:hypothetical protein KP509_21G005400 [Ceratopteris richardii]|uniref:Uncharacterized protein n=1 Tax=Ceratopteris richardii TaxID=49495 RepID=A0A8T2S921_CERRI|nr:hypothetical protein KP509_21G005400 [Ceratopteris richardii]